MNIDWTHKKLAISDVRKVKNFYVISVDDKKITSPIFVDHNIFEGRLKSFFLKNNLDDVHRHEILALKWNMVINQGYFVKFGQDNEVEQIHKDPNKFYISFLEVDGPLGTYVPK